MIYHLAIRQFARTLKSLDTILGKAQTQAAAKGFDVHNFFSARLFPDMLPFAAQVRIACDSAKAAAANLSGQEAPQHEDNETTFDELRARIAKCVAYLEGFSAKDFERTSKTTLVKMPRSPGKALDAEEYLIARQIPNFYFHVAIAYALLRTGGVEIGKKDYLGPLNLIDV